MISLTMANERVNFRHLYCFYEVARCNRITAASTKVHLSQPAITQAIAKLEHELGVLLFVRRSSGMFATIEGEVFLRRVERALNYLEMGAREALRLAQRRKEKGFSNFHHLITAPQLRALIAVAEAGNFSLAARQSGASQPSIHRRARELEQLTGVTLFEKTRSGIQPTKAALHLVRYAKLAFSEIDHGKNELNGLSERDTGAMAIGAMPLARAYILPKALTAFSQEYPDHNVSIIDGPYEQLLSGLRHGDIDILVGALRDPAPIDDVVQEPLFEDPLAIVMRSSHPLAQRKAIPVKELAQFPWIAPRTGTPLRRRFEELFQDEGVPAPRGFIECSSVIAVRGLLLESDRLTLLSPNQVHYEIAAGLLRATPHPFGQVGRLIAATVRRDWAPTRAQERFMELLKTEDFEAKRL